MVVWATVAEQYRIACGELESRQPAVIKNFFQDNVQFHEEAYWKIWRRHDSEMSVCIEKPRKTMTTMILMTKIQEFMQFFESFSTETS